MPANKRSVSLHSLEVAYLKSEIESQHNEKVKRALQQLCKAARTGIHVLPTDLNGLETSILGALVRGSSDEKVRRWSLSAISQIGRPKSCFDAVKYILDTREKEPQVMSAAIAAFYKLKPREAESYLSKSSLIDPKIVYLSALQVVPQKSLQITAPALNFEKCDNLTLMLSLLLVGMNKAPEYLFHPKYSNRDIIRELWLSDDDIVAQYSVWAAAENPDLTSSDISLDLYDIEGRSQNQRSYIYRLYASDPTYSSKQHEVILLGSDDENREARLGCAIGILDTWYEGIEQVTRDWYFREDDEENRGYLLDHMVRQSQKSQAYYELAVELYESFENDRETTRRMLAQASRLPISNEFKKIDFTRESGSLFPTEVINVTNETNIKFENSIFQGQTSIGGGNNLNDGQQTNTSSQDNRAIITATLAEATKDLSALPVADQLKSDTLEALKAAEKEPTPTRLEAAARLLKSCESALDSVKGMAEKGAALGGYAMALLHFLGS